MNNIFNDLFGYFKYFSYFCIVKLKNNTDMEEQKINVSKEKALNAYKNGDEKVKETLRSLFGESFFYDPINNIKTFDDAYVKLGAKHPLCIAYDNYTSMDCTDDEDVIAYLKLRIITAALNDGWKPVISYDYICYFPDFTQGMEDEFDDNSDGSYLIKGIGGIRCSDDDAVKTSAASIRMEYNISLALKNAELAKYCGRQFIDIWADYLLR